MTAWVRLELDVDAFDESRHRGALDRATADGVALTTMAALGDTAGARRALWALNRDCAADVPGREGFPSLEEYAADHLDVDSYDPEGVVVALDGATWVGLAVTSLREDDGLGTGPYAFSEITGVLRSHRGRGLAVAMKVHAVRFVRSHGYHWLRTIHHPENRAVIAMNLRLGFTKPPGP